MQTVYLDSSIIFHLAAPPSANPITRACQRLTRMWWETRMIPELTFISEFVEADIRRHVPKWVDRRLAAAHRVTQLELQKGNESLAELLLAAGGLKSMAHGRHIACAVLRDIEVLMTWNCRDLANARTLGTLRSIINSQRLSPIELVTPFELMENSHEILWQRNPARHRNP
ncbi:hypothetical protein ACLB1G_08990 [Oxalobacteraceae bacterium A2-2]